MKKLLSVFLVLMLISASTITFASNDLVEISMNDHIIKMNNVELESNSFSLNGKVYVPLEASLKLLDKKVDWISSPKTATISDLNTIVQNPIVTMEMESGKKIKMELYPEKAPNTVNNFIKLINDGFYNGLNFHRVIPEFMIQGGDPNGNGTGGAKYDIKGEFTKNNEFNDLLHKRGVVSMARSTAFDSASSQFFIVVKDSHFLNGNYAAFGKVIEGIEIADEIALVERDARDKPLQPQVIKTMTVDTFGKQYNEPVKITEESILANMYSGVSSPDDANSPKKESGTKEAKLVHQSVHLKYNTIELDDSLIMYDDTNYISIDSLKDLLKARLDYYSKNKTFNLLSKKQYLYQNNPLVKIELDNGKTLEIELYPSDAPNTVSNFIALIKNGFYKGKSFHRMLADNMIQGGQDLENTMKYLLPGEFATNGYENTLMQTRATISMVNFSSHPVSSPTEFFINVVDHPSLNGNFAPFGRVINGMDVIDEISRTKTDANASAINPVVIKNITVDTFNVNYKEARKMKLQNKVLN